jgi:16S rRNA (uracil1498-N3)-methyltransferase
MPVERFYLDSEISKDETLFLEDSEHHHLSHVIKMELGEEVELINGQGVLAVAQITEIHKKKSALKILSIQKHSRPSPQLILALPLMRPSKLEWVIEKGCELGADQFLLFQAAYSEKEGLSENQRIRLHNLCIAACKQSGRLYIPSIELLTQLEALFKRKALFLFGDTRKGTFNEIPKADSIVFISGPERGFSEQELRVLDKHASGIKLSANVLRAETAPIAAMSILGMRRC